jgi:hypothetical protein
MGITIHGRRYEVHTEAELMWFLLWIQRRAA